MPATTPTATVTAATRFRRLQEFTAALADSVSFQRVAMVVAERAAVAADASGSALLLLGKDARYLDVAHAWSRDGSEPALRGKVAAADDSPIERALRTHAAVFSDAFVALPLTVRNRTIGVIGFSFDDTAAFDEETRAFLLALSGQCALAIERAQLHELEANLRAEAEEEAERFRSLVQELDAIFWEADAKTIQFTFVSRRAEALLGYPLDRWTSDPTFWAGILHPEDRAWAVPFCIECTKKGEDHAFEYRAVAADGRIVWLRDIVYVVRDANGEPTKLRGVMVDITRERAAKEPSRVARVLSPAKPRSRLFPATLRLLSLGGEVEPTVRPQDARRAK